MTQFVPLKTLEYSQHGSDNTLMIREYTLCSFDSKGDNSTMRAFIVEVAQLTNHKVSAGCHGFLDLDRAVGTEITRHSSKAGSYLERIL